MLAVASGESSREDIPLFAGANFWVANGESKNGETMHPVWESHGICGCGKCELKGVIAWFTDRKTALDYALFRQRQVQDSPKHAGGNA
jgi:hypothetical protein